MKVKLFGLVATLALFGALSGEAQALDFNFSVTNDPTWGNVSGTFTGEVFGLVDNATSSATSVEIFTWPAGLIPLANQPNYTAPIDATTWNSQIENTFTVVAGVIVSGDFHADNATAVSSLDRLYLNGTGCQSGPTCSFLSLGSSNSQYIWATSNAFTLFTQATPTSTTPLPAALPLFATGLGALGLLGWRRKRKAALAA